MGRDITPTPNPQNMTSSTLSDKVTQTTCFQITWNEAAISKRSYVWSKFVFSLTPCVLLLVFSALLIHVIFQGRRLHASISPHQASTWRRTTRTTFVLLAISLCSIVSRLPYVVFVVVLELHTRPVEEVYFSVTWVLIDLNSSLNLIFYMISNEFRNSLKRVFVSPAEEVQSGGQLQHTKAVSV